MREQLTLKYKVYNTIKEYKQMKSGESIVIGVSGGPDSICLLYLLNEIRNDDKLKLKFNIYVAHVNHMLRKNAKLDEKYVIEVCKKLNIQCFVKKIDISKFASDNKLGAEEAGRIARYEFFDETLKKTKSQRVAIAHNANDNAETVLMNILRGSGITGIKGIEPIRDKYIRPLINISRNEIEEYCKKNKIKTRQDESNLINIYTRNKIRNELIPYIEKEFNPNIIDTLNRLSSVAKEETKYFNKIVENVYKEIFVEELKNKQIIFNLKKFNNIELVIKKRLILYTINKLLGTSKNIEKIHIEDIIKLCNKNIGNKYLTPNKHIKILVDKGEIFFINIANNNKLC